MTVTADDITRAAARLDGVVHRTPVLTSRALDERVGGQAFLKAECFQRTGSFKFRGASNAVRQLAGTVRGVVSASSGNHAQALALAAQQRGLPAVIVMPADAPAAKVDATRAYGAEIVTYDRYGADRDEVLATVATERALEIVHPYEDPRVIAGQGTVARELLDDTGPLDILVVPVGGGGLIAGCATAAVELSPGVRVIGVEPRAGDDTRRSLAAGERVAIAVPRTIADGQQAAIPGRTTFPIVQRLVTSIALVDDAEIVAAMRFLFERMKIVVEPSGATGVAALLSGAVDVAGARMGVVISGGNIGAEQFASLIAAAR